MNAWGSLLMHCALTHAHTHARTPAQRMMRTALLASPWDSFTAASAGGVFSAKLPDLCYDLNRGLGYNTLTLRAEYFKLKGTEGGGVTAGDFDRVYTAVNISSDPAAARDVLCHVCLRADPARDHGGGPSPPRWKYVQGYRVARWDTTLRTYRADGSDFPLKPSVPFWLRIVVHPAGFLTYLNGQRVLFTPHAPDRSPYDFEPLYVQLPLTGDKAERVTWKVVQMYWGSSAWSGEDEEFINKALADKGLPTLSFSPDRVRVIGAPPGTTPDAVKAAFAAYLPSDVVVDARNLSGDGRVTFVVKLADISRTAYALREMEGSTVFGGVPIHVASVLVPAAARPSPMTASAFSFSGAAAGSGGIGLVPYSPAGPGAS